MTKRPRDYATTAEQDAALIAQQRAPIEIPNIHIGTLAELAQPPAESRTVTIVVTVETDASSTAIEKAVLRALRDLGAETVGCDWAPDPDTIADCVDADTVEVLDLNGPR